MRVAHAVLSGAAGAVWLLLPGMTTNTGVPVAASRSSASVPTPVPVPESVSVTARVTTSPQAAPGDDETSGTNLILPVTLVGAAAVLAAYGYTRRVRRTRTRTTPAAPGSPGPLTAADELADLDERSRAALVETDTRRHGARGELALARTSLDPAAVEPLAEAVRAAEAELTAAFRIRQRYDEGVPGEDAARRHALAGVIGRCQEAARRLDAEAAALRELWDAADTPGGGALPVAEARFRELAARTATAQATLTDLHERYAPTASTFATGYVELAKDRLVSATTSLNQSHQEADSGRAEEAAGHLRAAEDAVAQAGVFIDGVDRLAAHLDETARLIPATLTGAEAALAELRTPLLREGETYSQLLHADAVLASVRRELTSGHPYDPADALRRIVRALFPPTGGRSGVLTAAATLVARGSTAAAREFVVTHGGTVDVTARTRLVEAEHLLMTDPVRADELACKALELAERDARLHGAVL